MREVLGSNYTISLTNINVQVLESGETYKFTDDVETAIDAADKLLEIGGFFFPEVKAVAGTVSTVGGIIKKLIGLFPKPEPKPDPVFAKLVELEKKMDELAYKMAGYFADMKEFVTEVNFLTTITVPTTNLMRFMQDCMKTPSAEALENFKSAYNDRKPLKIAYDMLSLLEHEKTNPLVMAMAADPLRKATTFNDWYKKMELALGQFLFLELFASGLFKEEQMFDANTLVERAQQLYKAMEEWREKYKKDPAYFGGMKRYVEDFLGANSKLARWELADKLRDDLSKVLLTNDALYVIVFMNHADKSNYAAAARNSDQLVEVLNKSGWSALVCRSVEANTVDNEKINEFWEQSKFFRSGFFPKSFDYSQVVNAMLPSSFPNAGCLCIADYRMWPEMRAVNCKKRTDGPGLWFQVTTMDIPLIGSTTLHIMVAYK